MTRADERRRLGWAIAVTTAILVVEVIGGLISGSLALLSDAGHMAVDSLALIMSFIAMRVSLQGTSEKFTFGKQRIEILVALINGVTLLIVCAFIVYEGIQRFYQPVEIDITMMLIVASIGITANIISAGLLKHAHSLNVRSAFLHVLGDLFSSIGIVVGGIAMLFWDLPWLDPALSIVIAGIILISAYRLIRESLSVLMEAAPSDIQVKDIRSSLLTLDDIEDVHDLHVWTITTGQVALSCHIVVNIPCLQNTDAALSRFSEHIREEFGIDHLTIQIESADYDENEVPCEDRSTGENE
jgi:cobalt-zinc-cadmium efflux system protein